MEIRHLRYFLAVAEELHFSRAAARLRMAQPPLSARIKDLEREIGVPLFDRSPRGVALTGAGRRLRPLAQRAVEDFDEVVRFGRTLTAPARPVRVALPLDTSTAAIEAFTRQVAAAEPGVRLNVVEATTAEQERGLRHGDHDIGLLRHPFPTSGLVVAPALATPLGGLLAADHPLAGRDVLAAADLLRFPLVLFPRTMAPGLYDEMRAGLDACGAGLADLRHSTRLLVALLRTERAIALRPLATAYLTDHPGELVWRPLADRLLPPWRTSVAWADPAPVARPQPIAAALVAALTEHDRWSPAG